MPKLQNKNKNKKIIITSMIVLGFLHHALLMSMMNTEIEEVVQIINKSGSQGVDNIEVHCCSSSGTV